MQEQVMVLFAGTQGYLDDVPVESVRRFEEEFLRYMRDQKAELTKELAAKKAIDDEIKPKMVAAVEGFKKGFQP
jgi:F-type H+-transporting ATPase subunit alpha